jgi:hypothetical protein
MQKQNKVLERLLNEKSKYFKQVKLSIKDGNNSMNLSL